MDRGTGRKTTERARVRRCIRVAALLVIGIGFGLPTSTTSAGATTAGVRTQAPKPVYALALGDSLAAGVGASQTSTRYVNVLATDEASTFPGLQLVNLACSGATVPSMIDGPGCSYTTGTQLGDAEAFVAAHPHEVAYITIDIGANDVDTCLSGGTINGSCITAGLAAVQSGLPQILSGLEAAAPGVAIYGMNYYDPFLDEWLAGSAGQTLAQESESLAVVLNDDLTQAYSAAGASTADVATPFQSSDFDLTGSWDGEVLPQNVADICNWTWMCVEQNIHANDIGHALIAQAFAAVVDGVQVTTTTLPEATTGIKFSTALAANGGHPKYRWSVAPGSDLPTGLKLNARGVLSGKPTTAETTTFTVEVTDHRLKVHSPPPVHTATATLSLTVG